jgi:hypothetical protein
MLTCLRLQPLRRYDFCTRGLTRALPNGVCAAAFTRFADLEREPMAELLTHHYLNFRLFMLTTQSVGVGLICYWKLSMLQLGRDYSPAVLAAIHYRQPGLTMPVILTVSTALLWSVLIRHAFRHEDDPL